MARSSRPPRLMSPRPTKLAEIQGRVRRKQALVGGHDPDAIGRSEAPGVGELAAEIEAAEEGEGFAEGGLAGAEAKGQIELGAVVIDQVGPLAAAAGGG